mmetsp:Transcript_3094/g.9434  ORF Transcript_3094/g.9434 Transcript_3094/m.9434 type:complete len:841 (+) Transcript_3094:36-2558(+)
MKGLTWTTVKAKGTLRNRKQVVVLALFVLSAVSVLRAVYQLRDHRHEYGDSDHALQQFVEDLEETSLDLGSDRPAPNIRSEETQRGEDLRRYSAIVLSSDKSGPAPGKLAKGAVLTLAEVGGDFAPEEQPQKEQSQQEQSQKKQPHAEGGNRELDALTGKGIEEPDLSVAGLSKNSFNVDAAGLVLRSPNLNTVLLVYLNRAPQQKKQLAAQQDCVQKFSVWYKSIPVLQKAELSLVSPSYGSLRTDKCRLLGYEVSRFEDHWEPIGGAQETLNAHAHRLRLKFAFLVEGDGGRWEHAATTEYLVFDSAWAARAELPPTSPFGKTKLVSSQVRLNFRHLAYLSATTVFADLGDERGYAVKSINERYNYDTTWSKATQMAPFVVDFRDPAKNLSLAFAFTEACPGRAGNLALSQSTQGGSFADGLVAAFHRKSAQQWRSSSPLQLPWFVSMFGSSSLELVQRQISLGSLCSPPLERYNFKDWVRPGKVLRDVELSTESVRTLSEVANKMNASYILLDAGWYGNERSAKSNPLRPLKAPLSKELDIPGAVKAAGANNVNLMLYVNEIALKEHNAYKIVDKLAAWGVKGIKMGFVRVPNSETWAGTLRILRYCAAKRLVVNIHDDFRESGLHRSLPHVLSVEGVRGDEYKCTNVLHYLVLPYARYLGGSRADHTFTLNMGRLAHQRKDVSFQVAAPFVLYNGLQHLYWYAKPNTLKEIVGRGALLLWTKLPSSWRRTVYLAGEIGRHISVARETDDGRWFVASLTAEDTVQKLDFSFLGPDKPYLASLYHKKNIHAPDGLAQYPTAEPNACIVSSGQVCAGDVTIRSSQLSRSQFVIFFVSTP